MAGAGTTIDSLRLSRREMRRLGVVLALSLALHLLVWGVFETGKKYGVWERVHWPAWVSKLAVTKVIPSQQPSGNVQQQLMFVDVPRPSAETPQAANYYSSRNSIAADSSRGNKDVPQLKGKQTEVVKTEDAARPDYNKLQPTPQVQPSTPQEKTARKVESGDLALGKPETGSAQQEQEERPRTLKEARARQPHLPGQQMKQDGGARRQALVPSLDVKATPFGDYDAALVEAVTERWYSLLDSQQFSMDRTGKVALRFHLNSDGSVTEMKVMENTVGDLLCYVCQKAVSDPAPFKPWPSDMRQMVGENYREITFTFYYY